MGKKAGSNRLKRQSMPAFWQVPRKGDRFAVRPIPGPHPMDRCYPLGILLRDLLKVVRSMREAEKVLHAGYVHVDGVRRSDVHFPIGLMDVVELQPLKKVYRMVPKDGFILKPVEVSEGERNLKICKVVNRSTVRGGRMQYTLHDGRSILMDVPAGKLDGITTHDSILIRLPGQEIVDAVRMDRGALALITAGDNAGTIGRVLEVKEGTITLPRRVVIESSSRRLEVPVDSVIAVGRERPLLSIGLDGMVGSG
ncbi:MAG: 30S ribosomal protein S4e [Candidatus Nitrosocaldus sp.]|nr:30S ribosomal protein S4e [Candidatus Nitrosocaldus sp.]MDW8000063.1 30S ribosomal protein S4e [Candidatus Nitrosocaldus sp.]